VTLDIFGLELEIEIGQTDLDLSLAIVELTQLTAQLLGLFESARSILRERLLTCPNQEQNQKNEKRVSHNIVPEIRLALRRRPYNQDLTNFKLKSHRTLNQLVLLTGD
jgi:hypothetical protein